MTTATIAPDLLVEAFTDPLTDTIDTPPGEPTPVYDDVWAAHADAVEAAGRDADTAAAATRDAMGDLLP